MKLFTVRQGIFQGIFQGRFQGNFQGNFVEKIEIFFSKNFSKNFCKIFIINNLIMKPAISCYQEIISVRLKNLGHCSSRIAINIDMRIQKASALPILEMRSPNLKNIEL